MQKFIILWIGQLASLTGSQLTGFALGVWVYQQTQSTTLFALMTALNVIPVILLSPLAGSLADRWNRRNAMLLGDLGSGICTMILAVCAWQGFLPIPLLALLTALNTAFSSFMRPAFTAAIAQLVPAEKLAPANSMLQLSYAIGALIAPLAGGLLLSNIGLWGVLSIDVATFLVAVVTQLAVQIPSLPQTNEASSAVTSLGDHPLYAWKFLRERPGLLALLLFFTSTNFLTGLCQVLMTPLILSFTNVSVLGAILSAGGAGMLVGGGLLGFLSDRRSRISAIVTFSLLGGGVLILVALKTSIALWFVGAFLFFLGMPLTHGSGQMIFQNKVPLAEQGRIFAFNEAVAGSALPISYLIAGPLSDRVFEPVMQPNGLLASSAGQLLGTGPGRGIALLFVIAGVLQSGLALAILKYPPLRDVERLLPNIVPVSDPPSPLTPTYERTMVNSELNLPTFEPPAIGDMPPAPKPLISIRNLNHYYGKGSLKKQVLFDINLDIYPGEIVIMTGPSGSGKTTLLTLIGALRSAQEGNLEILHQELNGAAAKTRTLVRRNIGFIFQGHNLLPFMTARQNVRMALELKSWSKGKAAQLKVDEELTKVGLEKHLDAYPEKLSGGQKQRVAIARALVNQPPLILADEPTASLDSQTGREVVQLMQKLAKEQDCTILLVTHDHRILDIADRIIHMEDGRLQSQATSAEVLVTPAHQPTDKALVPPVLQHDFELTLPRVPVSSNPDPVLPPPISPAVPQLPQPTPSIPPEPVTAPVPEPAPLSIPEPVATNLQSLQAASVVSKPRPSQAEAPVQERVAPVQTLQLPPIDFSQKPDKTYTIVCVDDSSAILYSMYAFLDDDLFSVALIQDPTEAVETISQKHPDVIILDIDMPQMDGYEVCTLVRQNQQFAKTLILFMTDNLNSFDRKRAKMLGVSICLTKPFNQADLVSKIFPHLT